ncbi:MAG: 1-acyl-sn-glycerol-3-phosphate acyltransferase [Anaerolineales bacterium]|nr:1-acyl-sn-glycerol-3-phosphate acyltransferase [Anaerolineales bacterium]
MNAVYRVPFRYRALRFTMKPLARALFRLLADVTISGTEHIPQGEPYVAAMNHISMFDPPFIGAFWPHPIEIIGAANVFDKPAEGLVLKMYGVIPVHRGEYDRSLLTKTIQILRSGLPLLIAPEGGRSHVTAMRRAKPGIAYIVEQTGAPVVPVGLVGTTGDFFQRAFRKPKPILEMRVGKPIVLPAIETRGAERHELRQQNADLVMSHLAGLLPEEYGGVYAGSAIRPA